MNLGDGLTFQLENGKPKLILSSCGVQSKNSKTVTRTRHQNVLKTKQDSEDPVGDQPQKVLEKRSDSRKFVLRETADTVRKEQVNQKVLGKIASKANPGVSSNCRVQPATRAPARPPSARKTKHMADRALSRVSTDSLKQSLVCLTQEQLQQILSTISQTSATRPQEEGSVSQPKPGKDGPVKETMSEVTVDAVTSNVLHSVHDEMSGNAQDERVMVNEMPAGLFSSLGERERDKEVLEAKRAQWRKELDEQMAERLQQKKAVPESLQHNPWPGFPARGHSKASSEGAVERGEEERPGWTISALEERTRSSALSYSSQQDLPAAIRSAFILGEASPVEHPCSELKQEQQRRWLQELEQQREEIKLRRQQEKRELSRAEDHERWAMHFDSLQKRTPSQPAQGSDRGEPDTPARSVMRQLSPSGTVSVTSEGPSPLRGESLSRASGDTFRGTVQRASYLRTMTSLLDPAQIEDRERKRLKQLEHQRAIEVQVEERRRQREQEEALRRAEEQQAEQRVERERESLQEQYQRDALHERQKQELHSQKTEQLYLSVQRAQQEAAKAKQEQRIRRLARRGHNVSKLLHCMEEESPTLSIGLESRGTIGLGMGRVGVDASTEVEECADPDTLSSRRDAAVQTDVGKPSLGVAVGTTVTPTAAGRSETPDVPAEYRPLTSGRRHRWEGPGLGKENVNVQVEEGGAGAGGDPYEAFARQPRQAQKLEKRPEWNTHKPRKAFVPASERYPSGLRKNRQDSRLRRQMELLTLVERNAPFRAGNRELCPPAQAQPTQKPLPHTQGEHVSRSPPCSEAARLDIRGCSPPVPAVKHRLQQQGQQPAKHTSPGPTEADTRPPSSSFVPYLRTDEVYQLDPLAPLSRPQTQGSQQPAQPGGDPERPSPPVAERDPLLHPELLKNRERQQAILRGLCELRQGLLQKQRELESGLNPLLLTQEGSPSPQYQHM